MSSYVILESESKSVLASALISIPRMRGICFQQKIPIFPSGIETYKELFSILRNGYELVGEESLASLGNRDQKVAELANYFHVVFGPDGVIMSA